MILQNYFSGHQQPCFIIAEIGSNFNGSLALARESVDAALQSGADAVKFQTYRADEFIADKELTYQYSNSQGQVITRKQYDMFRQLELPEDWHYILQDYAKQRGSIFLSSAADKAAIDLLIKMQVPMLKFASEDLINFPLLEYAAETGYPAILSTGMANEMEIDLAVELFKKKETPLILFHCTSLYPTPSYACNLNRITALKERYQLPVGFSDHTQGILAATAAVSMGACMIEKHFTLDCRLEGPDHQMSTNPAKFKQMVEQIRNLEVQLGQNSVNFDKAETQARIDYRRGIVAARNLNKGMILSATDLSYKRPAKGLMPYQKDLIIGRQLAQDIKENESIFETSVLPLQHSKKLQE